MRERLRYLDFELQIEHEGDHYLAKVIRSPIGEASGTFTLPFTEDRLENLVLKLGRIRASTRRIYSTEMEAAHELGGKLFEAVFSNEVRATLRSSLDEASRRKDTGLRIKLRLQDVAELADLPWEFLFDASLDRFFAQSNQTPIVRYIEMPQRIVPLTIDLPLKILVMISSPTDYAQLNVQQEKFLLEEALQELSKKRMVQLEWLEEATLQALQRRLRAETYHVFHFIGHGGFDPRAEEGVLVLEDERGRGWQAGAHRIGTVLHDHRSLRLVVLNSCEGARNSRTDPFAGVATSFVRQGIPAVVAMQFEITDNAAVIFSSEFYTALSEGFPVDAAVTEARKAIYAEPNDVEWGTPVLILRSPDGILFRVKEPPMMRPTAATQELAVFGEIPLTTEMQEEQDRAQAERLAAQKAEAERLAKEKAEADRLAAQKAEEERLAQEQAEAEQLAARKAEEERFAQEQAEAERLAKEKAEADRLAAQKAEEERLAQVQAEAERLA